MDEALAKVRHERSIKDFPFLTLMEEEYVEFAFKRAQVCLFMIMGGATLGISIILLIFLAMLLNRGALDDMGRNFVYIILSAILAAIVIATIIAIKVHKGNRLFITNKCARQLVMESLVSSSVNEIDLVSLEDASFRQDGIIQKLFHYGTLRLATVGDETTYTFKRSDIRPEELKAISKLIRDAKDRCKCNDNDACPKTEE